MNPSFDDLVAALPLSERTIAGGHCYFGISSAYGRQLTSLEEMPADPLGVSFHAGGTQEKLVRAFAGSRYAASVTTVEIGTSELSAGRHRDYAGSVAALTSAPLPRLSHLALGVFEHSTNSHAVHGRLGDITRIMQATPSVEVLELYGHFTLSAPLNLPSLRRLWVIVDDETTGPNVPPLSRQTVTNLLSGGLPAVEEIWLELRSYGPAAPRYRLPDTFLDGRDMPRLTSVEVAGAALLDGEADRLLTSSLSRTSHAIIDG